MIPGNTEFEKTYFKMGLVVGLVIGMTFVFILATLTGW